MGFIWGHLCRPATMEDVPVLRFPNPRLPHEVCVEKWVMLEEKISAELGFIGLRYQPTEFKLLKWKCFMYFDDGTVGWEWAEVFFNLYTFQMSSECLIGQN